MSRTGTRTGSRGAIRRSAPGLGRSTLRPGRFALRWTVVLVVDVGRMRIAAVTCPAGHGLFSVRTNARAREIRVDLTDQQNHVAGDVLPWIRLRFKRPAATVTKRAVDAERVAEHVHDAAAMDLRSGGQHFQ